MPLYTSPPAKAIATLVEIPTIRHLLKCNEMQVMD